jgi:hypothetical protein
VNLSVRSVRAKRCIRKLRGGTQAHLLETDDGAYVVKFFNNPQGHRILTNEFISSFLMQAFGLTAPGIALVTVPDELEDGSEISIIRSAGRQERPTGVHFGSRYPGKPGAFAIYDFFPDKMLPEVLNLEDFWGALVFDKWVSNADGRQATFHRVRVRSPENKELDGSPRWIATMIDNGLAFQGRDWCFRDSPVQGLSGQRAVYNSVTGLRSFERWFDALFALTPAHVATIMSLLPPEWIAGEEHELQRMLIRLLVRRREVPGLVAESLAWLEQRSRRRAPQLTDQPLSHFHPVGHQAQVAALHPGVEGHSAEDLR